MDPSLFKLFLENLNLEKTTKIKPHCEQILAYLQMKELAVQHPFVQLRINYLFDHVENLLQNFQARVKLIYYNKELSPQQHTELVNYLLDADKEIQQFKERCKKELIRLKCQNTLPLPNFYQQYEHKEIFPEEYDEEGSSIWTKNYLFT
jgi:hypothetical protein